MSGLSKRRERKQVARMRAPKLPPCDVFEGERCTTSDRRDCQQFCVRQGEPWHAYEQSDPAVNGCDHCGEDRRLHP